MTVTTQIGMSKPDDIPQDVWDVAENAFDDMLGNCIEASGTAEQFRIDSITPLARAILAAEQRERGPQAATVSISDDEVEAAAEALFKRLKVSDHMTWAEVCERYPGNGLIPAGLRDDARDALSAAAKVRAIRKRGEP